MNKNIEVAQKVEISGVKKYLAYEEELLKKHGINKYGMGNHNRLMKKLSHTEKAQLKELWNNMSL